MDDLPAIAPLREGKPDGAREVPVQTRRGASVPPDVRPYGRFPGQRVTTRYPFEFFQDQIESLRRFSLEEKMRGEKGSMSQMAREAFDMYIAKRLGEER